MKKDVKQYSTWQSVGFMVRTAWRVRKRVLVSAVALALITVARNLAELYLAPSILNQVERHASLEALLTTIVGFTLACGLLFMMESYLKNTQEPPQIEVRMDVLKRLDEKGLTTSYPNVVTPETHRLYEQASDCFSSNDAPAEHIWLTLTSLMGAVLGFAANLVVLRNLNGWLLLVILVTSAVGFLVTTRLNGWEKRHEEEAKESRKLTAYVERVGEDTRMAKDVRLFGLADWLMEIQEKGMKLIEAFVRRRENTHLAASLLDVALSFARNGIAYAYLIAMTLQGGLSASEFLLYFTAVASFSTWIQSILQTVSTLQREGTQLSWVLKYLNIPEPFRFEDGKKVPRASGYEWKLENVSFRYPGAEKDTIKHMNLTIRSGEKLAIVGLNGAGKTTLVKLLCGFFDPTEGRVLLNGTDIREFDRGDYYTLFSAVFQEACLLDLTIRETISLEPDGGDEQRVWACLEQAGLKEAVEAMPKGLDTHFGRRVFLDGIELSGGQTQRLLLARALYKNGPLLVLDEPTAALDPLAESDIYQKYNAMTRGKTSIFISHRLASTRFCDRILYLKDGAIAEEGTHEELLAQNGGYAHLFEVQSRYYQEGGETHEEC